MEWRPIETAPKDGTPIIALWAQKDSKHAESVYWSDGAWIWEQDGDSPAQDPTHWVPKPLVPKAG